LGLYDMHGNVWQWCADMHSPKESIRVIRGGSWGNGAGYCRAAFHNWLAPGSRSRNIGFRLARVPVEGK
jgi:formylglycine-generating enzyme required for sulfatase activity